LRTPRGIASTCQPSARQPSRSFCSRVDGSELRYNQDDVSLPDLIVCRPELSEEILVFVRRHGTA
jgi:hypothetical protein